MLSRLPRATRPNASLAPLPSHGEDSTWTATISPASSCSAAGMADVEELLPTSCFCQACAREVRCAVKSTMRPVRDAGGRATAWIEGSEWQAWPPGFPDTRKKVRRAKSAALNVACPSRALLRIICILTSAAAHATAAKGLTDALKLLGAQPWSAQQQQPLGSSMSSLCCLLKSFLDIASQNSSPQCFTASLASMSFSFNINLVLALK